MVSRFTACQGIDYGGPLAYLQQYADGCAHRLQAMSMQPPMQGMQPVVSPYTMELNSAASAAGYWADHLSADEQQRSYLAMQQVDRRPCIITACAVHGRQSSYAHFCPQHSFWAARILEGHRLAVHDAYCHAHTSKESCQGLLLPSPLKPYIDEERGVLQRTGDNREAFIICRPWPWPVMNVGHGSISTLRLP